MVLEGPSIETALASVCPNVLMVDLDVVDVDHALSLLTGRPDVLLVGLEADGARLLVLSGTRARSLGTDDLVGLIERPETAVATETSGDGFAAPLDARSEAVGEREDHV